MRIRIAIVAAATALAGASVIAQQTAPPASAQPQGGRGGRGQGGIQQSPFSTPPVRIYLYAGLKTHAEGQHDYPQFLADWSKLLMNRNAIVDGGLHFPSEKELLNSDVVVIYKGDAGYMSMEDRANLDAFMRRGGGIVSITNRCAVPNPAKSPTTAAAPRSTAKTTSRSKRTIRTTSSTKSHRTRKE